MKIGDRVIGEGNPPVIVADLSASHNRSLERGFALIEAAKAAGADYIKLQAYTPETVSIDVDRPEMYIGGDSPWAGMHLHDLYTKAHTPRDMLRRFFKYAAEIGIPAFATACSEEDVDFLETLGNPVYKIASMDIVNTPLIEYAASKGKPVIISTGMAKRDEVIDADGACFRGGNCAPLVLHCVSKYPCPFSEADVAGVASLQTCWRDVGYSDHTIGHEAAIMATALGAVMIEKHLTLSRRDGGPDDHFATEPKEFAELVRKVHEAHATMQPPAAASENPHKALRPSLYAIEDIATGDILTRSEVRAIRPSNGLPPSELPNVLGKRAKISIPRGTPLSWDLLV